MLSFTQIYRKGRKGRAIVLFWTSCFARPSEEWVAGIGGNKLNRDILTSAASPPSPDDFWSFCLELPLLDRGLDEEVRGSRPSNKKSRHLVPVPPTAHNGLVPTNAHPVSDQIARKSAPPISIVTSSISEGSQVQRKTDGPLVSAPSLIGLNNLRTSGLSGKPPEVSSRKRTACDAFYAGSSIPSASIGYKAEAIPSGQAPSLPKTTLLPPRESVGPKKKGEITEAFLAATQNVGDFKAAADYGSEMRNLGLRYFLRLRVAHRSYLRDKSLYQHWKDAEKEVNFIPDTKLAVEQAPPDYFWNHYQQRQCTQDLRHQADNHRVMLYELHYQNARGPAVDIEWSFARKVREMSRQLLSSEPRSMPKPNSDQLAVVQASTLVYLYFLNVLAGLRNIDSISLQENQNFVEREVESICSFWTHFNFKQRPIDLQPKLRSNAAWAFLIDHYNVQKFLVNCRRKGISHAMRWITEKLLHWSLSKGVMRGLNFGQQHETSHFWRGILLWLDDYSALKAKERDGLIGTPSEKLASKSS